jgi:triacylglycerol lipase
MIARLQRMILAGQLLLAIAVAIWLATARDVHPALAALLGLLAPIALHTAILTADFLLAFLAHGPWPKSARRGALPWLRAWALEIVDSVRTFSIAQPLFAFRQYPQPEHPTASPVLMVHGYFCNHAIWLPLARRLANAGHPLGGIDLEPPFCRLDEHAPAIADAVDRLRGGEGRAHSRASRCSATAWAGSRPARI